MLKMVFRVDTGVFLPGEFAVAFRSDLSLLPELASFSHPGLTAKLATDLVEFLMNNVKDTVDKSIVSAAVVRARLLLQLFSIFNGMSVTDLAFQSKERKCMIKIELQNSLKQHFIFPEISYKLVQPTYGYGD